MSTLDGLNLARVAVQRVGEILRDDYHVAEEAGVDMALAAIDTAIRMYTQGNPDDF